MKRSKGVKSSSSEKLRACVATASNYQGMNQGSDNKDGEEGKHFLFFFKKIINLFLIF